MTSRSLLALLALLVLALAGCTSSIEFDLGDEEGALLAETRTADRTIRYKLYAAAEGGPSIHRQETRALRKASLGVDVADIDDDLAKRLGAARGRGVFLATVRTGSPAARAGLLADDILLTIDGVALGSAEQLGDLLSSRVRPGTSVSIEAERRGPGGAATHLSLTLTPDAREEDVTSSEAIPLERLEEAQRYTGLQVAEVPPDLAAEIYGERRPLALVSGVVVGSPAYLGGFRRGDRIARCDGRPVDGVGTITEALDLRLGRVLGAEGSAGRGDPIDLEVEGRLGPHRAELPLTSSLEESTRFRFPILFSYFSDISATRWSFLDFIFQFGANYDSRYASSTSREPAEYTELSLFPLGMFEFEFRPDRNRYTVLWLISWTTSR